MSGLDEHIAGLSDGAGLLVAVLVALLLGLRHATDPDHLAAVSALLAGDREAGGRDASRLGLAWGAGHAATLLLFGLPIVLWGDALPDGAQRGAELLVAALIVGLALRLLWRWHAGRETDPAAIRSARTALGIGLVHGMGGSAGVGILIVATIERRTEAVAALVVLAGGAAVAMTAASAGFGSLLAAPRIRRHAAVAPALAVATAAFGVWYGLGALGAVHYAL